MLAIYAHRICLYKFNEYTLCGSQAAIPLHCWIYVSTYMCPNIHISGTPGVPRVVYTLCSFSSRAFCIRRNIRSAGYYTACKASCKMLEWCEGASCRAIVALNNSRAPTMSGDGCPTMKWVKVSLIQLNCSSCLIVFPYVHIKADALIFLNTLQNYLS